MKKIAFFGIAGDSRSTYSGALPNCDGLPRSSGNTIDSVLELFNITENTGNIIHGEAPTRMFHFDRCGSCYVSVQALDEMGWSPERIGKEISTRFDMVVFSAANAIRPNFNPGCTWQVLDALTIEFLVLGLGIQNPLPNNLDLLSLELINLLSVCNRKAVLFGVRAHETEKWLHAVGYKNAKAIGCPSLFTYPQNIISVRAPDAAKVKSVITGGYISERTRRSSALINLLKGFDAHYVMQEEMAYWRGRDIISNKSSIYNDATGEVDLNVIGKILGAIHDEEMPFKSYRWFQNPSAWRMFSSRFDLCFSDRLHGGVAALQSGVPTIFMVDDFRVREIVEFFALPSASIADAEDMDLREIIAKRLTSKELDNFKTIYTQRFMEFEATMGKLDIPLHVGVHSFSASVDAAISMPAASPKKRVTRFIRRWLRQL